MKPTTVLAAAFVAFSATPTLAAMSDQEFIDKAVIGGKYELESSRFALTAAPDARVKAFANRMITDHIEIDARLKAIAREDRIRVPSILDDQHHGMLLKLQSTQLEESSGAAQRAYITQQAEAHKTTVALFEQYAREGTNPRLKHYAQAYLPTLREHHRAAAYLSGSR